MNLRQAIQEKRLHQTPVALNLGCGARPIAGFLNLDRVSPRSREPIYRVDLTKPWAIPSETVNYIYSEDFFEHLTQSEQLIVLAEALRCLVPSGIHRINCPALEWVAQERATFSLGARGVPLSEWTHYGHKLLPTRAYLDELAQLVGYRRIQHNNMPPDPIPQLFPYYRESRPDKDRDPLFGNLRANLLK